MDNVIHILDIIGTAVFAITGALAAGRKQMDIIGVVVLGLVTALGGGTLRDVILGIHPVFWISNTYYLAVAATAAISIFLLANRWRLPAKSLMYADALGLAVFTIIGFQVGFRETYDYSVAIFMGVTTAVVGGIIRDVLSAEIPLVFRREIYASASLCGAVMLALMSYLQLPSSFSVPSAILTTLIIRLIALQYNLALPLFRLKKNNVKSTNGEPKTGGKVQ